MVDFDSIGRANMLKMEHENNVLNLQLFDGGARIRSVIIGIENGEQGQVNTEYMQYPSMMVDTIKQFIIQRNNDIKAELEALGVQIPEGRAVPMAGMVAVAAAPAPQSRTPPQPGPLRPPPAPPKPPQRPTPRTPDAGQDRTRRR